MAKAKAEVEVWVVESRLPDEPGAVWRPVNGSCATREHTARHQAEQLQSMCQDRVLYRARRYVRAPK